jgi:hypothetical protein
MWIKLILSVVSCFGFLQAAEDTSGEFYSSDGQVPLMLMPTDDLKKYIDIQDKIRADEKAKEPEEKSKDSLSEFTHINSTSIIVEDKYAGQFSSGLVQASGSKKHILFIQQLSVYKDVPYEDGQVYHYGVAIRWVIKADVEKIQAGLTLPVIAIGVQGNTMSATATFDVDGCCEDKILRLVPLPRTFDVQAFADFNHATAQIRDLLSSCNLKPGIVLLPAEDVKTAIDKKLEEGRRIKAARLAEDAK